MESSSDQHPVEALAEEFLSRKRRGENPAMSEYTEKYPEWADEIAEIFSAMELIEDFKPARTSLLMDLQNVRNRFRNSDRSPTIVS